MLRKFLADIQTWLADRIPWMQYPHLYRVGHQRRIFSHRMPFGARLDIALFSIVGVIIGSAALAAALVFLYLLASALLS